MMTGDESDRADASEKFKIAQQASRCVDMMESASDDDCKFQTSELKPKIATTTEQYATDRHRAVSFPGSGEAPDIRAAD